MKHLNEYTSAESEKYEEQGLEGVLAKDIVLNVYPKTSEQIIRDFDEQCDKGAEFKNKNLSMLRSLITFHIKYHSGSKYINEMAAKYNIK
jgi:hypothetical protein